MAKEKETIHVGVIQEQPKFFVRVGYDMLPYRWECFRDPEANKEFYAAIEKALRKFMGRSDDEEMKTQVVATMQETWMRIKERYV